MAFQKNKFTLMILSLGLCVAFGTIAKPLSKSQKAKLSTQDAKQQGFLKTQMSHMIVSIADLDILTNRDEIADYEIFIEGAGRIL